MLFNHTDYLRCDSKREEADVGRDDDVEPRVAAEVRVVPPRCAG